MVIEKERFDYIKLTYCETFTVDLIKRAESRSNKSINFPHDTKRCIWEIAINNGWNIYIIQILCVKYVGNFLFKGKFLSGQPKPVELSHDWVETNLKYQEPYFNSLLFDDS